MARGRITHFESLRSDWYSNNSVLPGLFRKAIKSEESILFIGFPRQWLPIFEYFGIKWSQTVDPPEYIPFFSDLSENELLRIIHTARKNHSLRSLVESTSIFDSILSDFLYIIDNTLDIENPIEKEELAVFEQGPSRPLKLNGWQSYGRNLVHQLEVAVNTVEPRSTKAVILPCSLRRPYHRSRTHKRIYSILKDRGYNLSKLHKIVVTSLGILPEEVWGMPQVLYYDAGVPDIYRILRLARGFFKRCAFTTVIDCLSFEPFSDIIRIIQKEGLIGKIVTIKIPGKRPFYVRP
jgi:hypothetical protein